MFLVERIAHWGTPCRQAAGNVRSGKGREFRPRVARVRHGQLGSLRSYTVLYSDSVMRVKNILSGWIAGFASSVS